VAAQILIIDSDPAAWADVLPALEQADCEVVCAPGAPAALAALEKSRFNLVLCDRHVPYREGSALAVELTRRLPDGRCGMTSREDPAALADEALARGWSEVVAAPAPAAVVLLALRRANERIRLRRRAALLEEDLARAAGDRLRRGRSSASTNRPCGPAPPCSSSEPRGTAARCCSPTLPPPASPASACQRPAQTPGPDDFARIGGRFG